MFKIKKTFFIFFFIISSCHLHGQIFDSISVKIGSAGTIATRNHQPLWLVSNQFDAISDKKQDLSNHIFVGNQLYHTPQRKKNLKIVNTRFPSFYMDYGIDLFNNTHFNKSFVGQGFVKAGFRNWEFRIGRFRELQGEADKELSSGALGVSGNALPIPKLGFAVTEYTNIPFTDGWLQFKGLISHGWMGKNQFFKDAFLHEKSIYGRIGKNRLKFFAGIQHFAVWGGRRKDFPKLDRDWKGFMDVLLVKEADDGSVGSTDILPNRAGDHRGVVEGGLDWETRKTTFHLYHQTPFDSGQGITFKNIDKLLGLSVTTKKDKAIIKKIVGEFIYTKQMNNFYAERYRESYYNNGRYATGWEYENKIIGTPLFINRTRGSYYFDKVKPFDWNVNRSRIPGNNNIINNRIIGGHLGISYSVNKKMELYTVLTFTRNYGSYIKRGPFVPYKDQFYFLQQVSYDTKVKGLSITGKVAVDHGELTKNTGLFLGVEWLLYHNLFKL